MKNRLLLGLLFFITALGFSQSSPGGATPIPKIRITTPLVNNPLRGKVVVQDSVTKNLDMIEMDDLATALGSGGISEVTGVSGEITVASGTTAPVIGISSDYTTARNTYADGKISSTITDGVTTSAPNENAVFDALALKANLAGGNTFTGTQLMPILGVNCTTPLSGVPLNVGNPTSISGAILPVVAIQSMGNNIQGVTMENTSTGSNAEMRFIAKADDSSYLFFTQPGSANTSTAFFGVPKNTGSFIMTSSNRNLHIGTNTTGTVNIGTNNTTGMTMNTSQVVSFVNSPTVPTAVGSSDAVPLAQMNMAIGTATGLSVPLAGTTDPITGNLEINETTSYNGIRYPSATSGIKFQEDAVTLKGAVRFEKDGSFNTYNDEFITANETVGFSGSEIFDKQNAPNAFAQIGDNHAIGLGITATAGSPLPSNDLDLITHPTGIYSFTNAATGNPTSDNGSVTIERISTNIVQTAKVINAVNLPRVFIRQYKAGSSTWTDWNELASTGNTGWASYSDTVYTSGSPFSITSGTTSTLPNNAGTVINTQLPTGVTSFYDSTTNKFTPQLNGDYYIATVRFKAQTTAAVGGYFDFGIDIGGALGVQFNETKIFAKGAGIEHNFSITVPCYTAATFVANGGLVKITSGLGTMTIYDINYQFDRLHKSK